MLTRTTPTQNPRILNNLVQPTPNPLFKFQLVFSFTVLNTCVARIWASLVFRSYVYNRDGVALCYVSVLLCGMCEYNSGFAAYAS